MEQVAVDIRRSEFLVEVLICDARSRKKVKQSYDECSAFVQYVRIRCTLPEKKKKKSLLPKVPLWIGLAVRRNKKVVEQKKKTSQSHARPQS